MEEAKRRPFRGSVLQLGRSSVFFSLESLERKARKLGFRLASGVDVSLARDPVLAAHGCLDDTTFFRLLGFDEVLSLDHTDWEGADLVWDLNQPLPDGLGGPFDLVIDGGTLQSVFHVPQALANIHALVAEGGRMIHTLAPSSNHVDLGFYMFSPTFFRDYYETNGWRIEDVLLCVYFGFWSAGLLRAQPFDVYDYRPGSLDPVSYGRFGGRQLGLWVACTRIEGATADRIPQQDYYRRLWSGEETEPSRDLEARARAYAWKRRLGVVWTAYKWWAEHARRFFPRPLPGPRRARY